MEPADREDRDMMQRLAEADWTRLNPSGYCGQQLRAG